MKDLGSLLVEGGVEGIIMNLMHSLGKTVQEKGEDYLKSQVFGIGTNDEHLFLSACAYAISEKLMTSDDLAKICKAIESLEKSQRTRVIGVIGKEEVEVNTEKPTLNDTGGPVLDGKGKAIMTKTKIKANVKGAQMLAMLAKLDEAEIVKVLATSGASASFIFDLKQKTAAAIKTVENSQIKNDGDNLFAKETWLERKLREKRSSI